MKTFLGDDFLLSNKVAEELYHEYAKQMPVIDYHNHLPPKDIAENRRFNNITEAWLEGDHYKWRAMRAAGIEESYITGNTKPLEKFMKWAETVPYTMRNPLYHWTHLELKRYFGINELLDGKTGAGIYAETQGMLQKNGTQDLLGMMNVRVVCTTDDPVDDLKYHQDIAKSDISLKVLPSFRPDKALGVDNPGEYKIYLEKLEAASGIAIRSMSDLLQALKVRVEYFHENGCRVSDLGFNTIPLINDSHDHDAHFVKILEGKEISHDEAASLQAHILLEICKMYHEKGWAQQFHLGALRNNNERAFREQGPDTGYDSIGDFSQAVSLSKFLNRLDNSDQLGKTILYNLNPRDNDLMATMIGNFQDGVRPGKIQFGTGWWFLDQKMGMEAQINSLSNMGLLSRFIGMLTDSRSFLSFPRHEYFRRILCNLLGQDVMNGELPHDIPFLGAMVQDISYNNANNYFEFE